MIEPLRLILLPVIILADVIASVSVVGLITTYVTKADVIACFDDLFLFVEDVISTFGNIRRYGRCYCLYVCGRCYNHKGCCYCPFVCHWLMLMPMCGRCYSHFLCNVGGWCYCQVADGMATIGWCYYIGLMLLPTGRCYCLGS